MEIYKPFLANLLLLVLFGYTLSSCKNKEVELNNTKDLFRAMKIKNDNSWYKNFTFKQHTLRFDENGQQTDSTVWYESVSYPYHFRIDRDIKENIYTIYRNDSTYNFRQDTLFSKIAKPAAHLVFKGGLYFISLEESLDKLQKYGYDTNAFRKDKFKEQAVYVIGNEKNQIWLHANNFYCMRRIYTTDDDKTVDVVYDNFKPLGQGFVEQKVTFYVEGKKRLEEFYFDIKLKNHFDAQIYDANTNYKWYLDY
ncbi:hypothetical protein [uncultured Allomuricauda sp.]|uniref:hypothetical protein n=1 Tax=Flagellimonas sp. W118 TaxID=3410791 RepID=UPI0026197B76|nr:hypothetical protein [uncultured Allomuricauda sp.]